LFLDAESIVKPLGKKKERLARIELAAAKAKAEAEQVVMRTAEVGTALERQRQARIQQEEAANRALTAQARYEGQRIHTEMQNFQRQVALDKERQERHAASDRSANGGKQRRGAARKSPGWSERSAFRSAGIEANDRVTHVCN
jgi:hypothetical protein